MHTLTAVCIAIVIVLSLLVMVCVCVCVCVSLNWWGSVTTEICRIYLNLMIGHIQNVQHDSCYTNKNFTSLLTDTTLHTAAVDKIC